ncbi:MAG TPA: nucleotidyltransferase family protein [Burkholderiales bacterium]|jgi:molybdenum cofactor cytidylyltransferase|nr:nucleotidyltransferase family protein [Burkholderiales bacterium]
MAANIRGILLAAGYAKRFGSNKLLQALPAGAPEAGTPIGLAAARHLLEALPESIAVVRPRAQKLGKMLRDAGCNTVVCRNAGEGMGTSLAAGVRAASEADGWVVALADMPFIRPETIRTVAKALRDGEAMAAPSFQGRRGHPVGFARRFYEELSSLHGDDGARQFLERHPEWVKLFEVDDPGAVRDIDKPSDLER